MNNVEDTLKGKIRDIPDYPKKGILFRDITPLLKDGSSFALCVDELAKRVSDIDFDYVVGIEARGFIIGAALAYKMKKGFIPIRKLGKLPYRRISKEYALEYGTATIEMHHDALAGGQEALLVDDLLATGGTAKAAAELVESVGGKVAGFAFVIELAGLNGRSMLGKSRIDTLMKY
ncbi:MAG: adenine phosphoribosyltransferase [Candidatus Micrarchaeota archaeon]|nr:adenine phosphoribosyltransferase [Candidatus Micrarchaeota archaeon]MDE1849266.1 adenine phosphoribosyltransferase [Candidatus Micrarchaeota archaeon]